MNELIDKIGPYRVEDRLGVGGMGEVYKAYDDRLDRWVAIKRIRPDKENADDNRERFQREAKATAQLNHNSIVHLYDIFQEGESDCIVMEYVEGRTLDTLVVQGPLDAQLVINLGYEIASGLAEAHSKGIVHRDLKVENIIITPDNHAKILDFGLAKPILSNELDDSLTGKGQLVGTSRAMSPEYVSGEDIDHRSDIFSFGVLLYEAATGHSPFKAHNTLATLKQVMLHAQTPACQLNSLVPVELSDLIDMMLEKAPDDRPQNAEEVAVALNDLRASFSSGSTIRPRFSGSTASLRRESGTFGSFSASATAIEQLNKRPALWILMFLIPVILGGSIVAWLQSRDSLDPAGTQNPTKKDLIVIADFENRTGEAMFDGAVDYAFRVDLEQSKHARVLSDAQAQQALLRMELDPDIKIDIEVGREICLREGAKALVVGTLIRIDPVYELTGTVINPTNGETRFSKTIQVNKERANQADDGIISAVGEITQAIRVHLGESLRQIEETPSLERVTTSNLRALRAYTFGVEQMGETNYDEAIRYFSQALTQDPEFAMAHGKLAALHISFKRDFVEGLSHIDQALTLTERLTEYEELYLRGWEARLRGNADDVARAWSMMSSFLPEAEDGHRNTGMAYSLLMNRFEEAAVFFEKAIAIPGPTQLSSFQNLGFCRLALEEPEKALESFLASGEDRSWNYIVDTYIVLGRHGDALSFLTKLEQSARIERSHLQARFALVYMDQGNIAKALDAVHEQDASQTANRDLLTAVLGNLTLQRLLQNPERVESAVEQALETLDTVLAELERDPSIPNALQGLSVPVIAQIARAGIRAGFDPRFQEILERLEKIDQGSLPLWTAHIDMLRAEIALAQGDPQAALIKSRNALSSVDAFALRESLARMLVANGMSAEALEQYRWLSERQGRAIIECWEGCQIANLVDWHSSRYHMAKLQEEMGDTAGAKQSLELFVDHWGNNADIPKVAEALDLLGVSDPQP